MITLQNDYQALFSPESQSKIQGEDKGWYSAFMPGSPIIFCNFSLEDLRKNKFLYLIINHEIEHYISSLTLLPTAFYYISIALLLRDLHHILLKRETESKHLVLNPSTDIFIIEPPLTSMAIAPKEVESKQLDVPFGFNYLFEGLALISQQYDSVELDYYDLWDEFLVETFGSKEKRPCYNELYWHAYTHMLYLFYRVFDKVSAYYDCAINGLFSIINTVPFLTQNELRRFYNAFFNQESSKNFLESFKNRQKYLIWLNEKLLWKVYKLMQQPSSVKKIMQHQKKLYPSVVKLFNIVLNNMADYYNQIEEANELIDLVLQLCEILYRYIVSHSAKVSNETQISITNEISKFSFSYPYSILKDNTIIFDIPYDEAKRIVNEPKALRFNFVNDVQVKDANLMNEQYGIKDLWLNLFFALPIVSWYFNGGEILCPLCKHTFCREYQIDLCGQSRPSSDEMCRLNESIIELAALTDRNCLFWRLFKNIFNGFKTIKIIKK